jgi:hypothetical protein
MYCCHKRRFVHGSPLHFLLHTGRAWVVWTLIGSPVGGVTDRSGDLDSVGRYRGTRDSGEKVMGVTLNPVNTQIRTNGICVSCGHKLTCLRYLCIVLFGKFRPPLPLPEANPFTRAVFVETDSLMSVMLSTLNLTFCVAESIV